MAFWDNFASAQAKSDFSVEIHDADWDAEWGSLVSKQTTRLELNLVKRTLVFHLRQTVKGVIQDVIFHVLTSNKIDHILVRPAKNPNGYEYHFKNGVVVDHSCDFAYVYYGSDGKEVHAKGPLIHVLTVEFAEVELKTPPGERRHSVVLKEPVTIKQLNG
jgi:hypothetical protein